MKHFFILCLILSLAACGSTSGINTENAKKLNLSSYDNAVVLDFLDSTKPSESTKPSDSKAFAGKKFADLIATHINAEGVFKNVSSSLSD